jgi:hypothetical protein
VFAGEERKDGRRIKELVGEEFVWEYLGNCDIAETEDSESPGHFERSEK